MHTSKSIISVTIALRVALSGTARVALIKEMVRPSFTANQYSNSCDQLSNFPDPHFGQYSGCFWSVPILACIAWHGQDYQIALRTEISKSWSCPLSSGSQHLLSRCGSCLPACVSPPRVSSPLLITKKVSVGVESFFCTQVRNLPAV